MSVIISRERATFNTEQVRRGSFIRAKYHTWEESRNGLLVSVRPELMRVLFLTGINQAASYYPIRLREVEAGLWAIKTEYPLYLETGANSTLNALKS